MVVWLSNDSQWLYNAYNQHTETCPAPSDNGWPFWGTCRFAARPQPRTQPATPNCIALGNTQLARPEALPNQGRLTKIAAAAPKTWIEQFRSTTLENHHQRFKAKPTIHGFDPVSDNSQVLPFFNPWPSMFELCDLFAPCCNQQKLWPWCNRGYRCGQNRIPQPQPQLPSATPFWSVAIPQNSQ